MQAKKIITIIIGLFLVGILIFGLFFFQKSENKEEAPNPYANSVIEVSVFEENDSFGYDILIDSFIYVHQPNIPAVGGSRGFKTKEDAEKAANLVVQKIRNNIIPPTIEVEELKELGVI